MSEPIGPGMKVECVDDKWNDARFKNYVPCLPVRGGIYTVRELDVDAIRLVELRNPIQEWGNGKRCEAAFYVWRFRPIRDFKKQIEAFKKTDADVFGRVTA